LSANLQRQSQIFETIARFGLQRTCTAKLGVVSGDQRAKPCLKVRHYDGVLGTREEVTAIAFETVGASFRAGLTTLNDDGLEPGEQADTIGDGPIILIVPSLDRVDCAHPNNSREQTQKAQGQGTASH